MNEVDSSMEPVLAAYRGAVFARDVEAFMSLYDDAVRVFDTWGVWFYEGSAAWRKMIEEWFDSLGAERVNVTFEDVRATPGPSLAVLSAIVTYAGVSAEGAPLRSLQNRLTWALRREGTGWKIVHEHTSAPVGFTDSKAILRRPDAS